MKPSTSTADSQGDGTLSATCSTSFAAWSGSTIRLSANYPPRRTYVGPLHEESRLTVEGPTGAGKSMLGMGWSSAAAKGERFLQWPAGARARWLYLDYEMGYREVTTRLKHFATPGLTVICFDDPQLGDGGLLPIDTPKGRQQVAQLIRRSRSVGVTIDNLYSAVESSILGGSGDGGQAHRKVVPFLRALSKERIGVLLLAHMNGKGDIFGDKRLTWQMTARFQIARLRSSKGLTIKLTCAKWRGEEGMPPPTTWEFVNGIWRETKPTKKRDSDAMTNRLALGMNALNSIASEKHPGDDDMPRFVTPWLIEAWREAVYEAYEKSHPGATANAKRQEFRRVKEAMIEKGVIHGRLNT